MKRTVAIILVFLLIFSLAACAAPVGGSAAPDAPAQTGDEYERALSYGFVPDELADADPDTMIELNWLQYCGMLGRMIEKYDASLMSEWQELTKDANSYSQMRRDDAMIALLFAAKTMDMASLNAEPPAVCWEYGENIGNVATYDYPVFDWEEPYDLGNGHTGIDHTWPAYVYSQGRVSPVSGKHLLEFDENGDLRLEQPLTLREAAVSILRARSMW